MSLCRAAGRVQINSYCAQQPRWRDNPMEIVAAEIAAALPTGVR